MDEDFRKGRFRPLLVVESNSIKIINTLNHKSEDLFENVSLMIDEIEELSPIVQVISFAKCPRSDNFLEHNLASTTSLRSDFVHFIVGFSSLNLGEDSFGGDDVGFPQF